MSKKRIGVLRGGPSSEYDISLQTGSAVLSALRGPLGDEHAPIDIFIDKAGVWHIDGISVLPSDALSRVDAVINALHGPYGEDGTVQSILESHGIAFTGSKSFASSIGMNKALSKEAFIRRGLKTPLSRRVSAGDIRTNVDLAALDLFRSFPMPVVVKPLSGGSSVGVSVARTLPELTEALFATSRYGDVLVEELISGGVEASVGIIESFRGHDLYALPPIEIRLPAGSIFGSAEKYSDGEAREIVPASFSSEVKAKLESLAREAHAAIGARHYSRSDFIVHPRRGIYILEVNTLPGLSERSLMPKALAAVGAGMHDFVRHILDLARRAE